MKVRLGVRVRRAFCLLVTLVFLSCCLEASFAFTANWPSLSISRPHLQTSSLINSRTTPSKNNLFSSSLLTSTTINRTPYKRSPFFTTSKDVVDGKISGLNRPIKTNLLLRRLIFALPSLLVTTIATRAWASATATTATSFRPLLVKYSSKRLLPIILSIQCLLPWTKILQISINIWVASLFISNYRMRLRQSENATSEWPRYAKHPFARGRSIMWLLTQQACLIFCSQLIRFRKSRRTKIREYAGRHLANSLLRLGPLYVKLGQIISCRKNLLGPEWIDAMAILQDQIPAREGQEALDLAYSTLEGGKAEFDQLFIDFDPTPLAAASLGQVHRAVLRSTGDEVAVKVQRPFLRQIYDQDLKFLTTIAQWMDKMPSPKKNVGGISSSWTKIFQDAEEILYREIDYRDEADNGVRFSEDFGLTLGGLPIEPKAKARNNQTLPSAAEWIRTPYVYKDISNERLLIMEFVPSIKITNNEKLKKANVTTADKIELADSLARAYLRQFCCNLFFSTDPHPGNLGVEIAPSGKPRLVLYDFGQAASLTKGQADGILSIIEAIIDMDVDRSIEAFQQMGVLVDGADLDMVRSKVADNYRTGKVKANRKRLRGKGYLFRDDDKEEEVSTESSSANKTNVDATATSSDSNASINTTAATTTTTSNDMEVMSFFSLPAEYAFVARALSQMDGVGKSLDPDFDFISNSAPYIVEIKGADKYLKEEITKFITNIEKRVTQFQMKLMNPRKTKKGS